MNKINSNLAALLLFSATTSCAIAQGNDCIVHAAQCFKINPLVIKAIIWQESGNKPGAVQHNRNKTIDVGLMQINSIHFNRLKSMGINETQLRNDSCANVFAGTWILKENIDHYGYNWDSIGNFHSKTPKYHDAYMKKIISLIAYKTRLINKINIKESDNISSLFSCPQE
ncbi:lytic transglycosylase domain-containing protein [Pantoea agglomerans]|uniref:lytic transglycosylase domain-containing protein n=1 Tax=Enterobacter agglomerans TaxID=549 RepID=UPI0013BD7998|nr:lytic transglycosylase domain-containing protein [Pantoea agglomerans]NEG59870.1 transglycosylase SLT domain-containing protein [Pantoea agglomerans]NEG98839.1 transglycosylase SLT domain-containing protein [Pantoea agglomerans]NEH05177.1 transglycosylase SLT domain-containing protein [Pantoea agglomerans]NEH16166.1 transglycosylase SLT domain-containing protein [Pantoea agglomerans]